MPGLHYECPADLEPFVACEEHMSRRMRLNYNVGGGERTRLKAVGIEEEQGQVEALATGGGDRS